MNPGEPPSEVPRDAAAEAAAAEVKRQARAARLKENAAKGRAKKAAQPKAPKGGDVVPPPAPRPTLILVKAEEMGDDAIGKALVERFTKPVESAEDMAELLADLFAVPETLIDESYCLADPLTGKPNARCKTAARRLWPLCRKYNLVEKLPLIIPELLAIAGVVVLLKPCVKPTWDIITGKKAPVIWRDLPADATNEQVLAELGRASVKAAGMDAAAAEADRLAADEAKVAAASAAAARGAAHMNGTPPPEKKPDDPTPEALA